MYIYHVIHHETNCYLDLVRIFLKNTSSAFKTYCVLFTLHCLISLLVGYIDSDHVDVGADGSNQVLLKLILF
jgi:hypothetical protein